MNLDKASIMYWPTALGTSPTQPDLTRLEAARKALARGQAIGGYWAATRLSPNEPIQAPMLALLDCYLLLSSAPKPRPIQQSTSAPDNRRPEVQEAINAAGSTFGEDFPDVVAIRCSIANKGIDVSDEQRAFEDTLKAIKLSGPPLLANSWRKLLEPGSTNAELSRVMPFEFVPEATGTWFTWTEEVGARRKGAQNDWGGAIGKAVTQAVGEHAGAALNAAAKGLATLMKDGRPGLPGDQRNVTFLFAGCDIQRTAHLGQPERVGACRDGGDEVLTRLRSVGFEFGFVHGQRRSRYWAMRSKMVANGTWPA